MIRPETPPDALLERLELQPGETVLQALASDMDLARRFRRAWLIVTDSRVAAADDDGAQTSLLLAELDGVKVDELFGGGRLLAIRRGAEIPLAYYSNACMPEFASLGRMLDARVRGEPAVPPDRAEAAHCPSCAMPLPERGGDCPLCLPRWRLLARILGLLRPHRLAASALMALTFATVAIQLSTPYITKMIVDEVIKEQRPERLGLWIGAMAAAALLLLVIRSANRSLTCWLGGRLVDGLRTRLHAALQRFRLGYFHRRDSGEVVGRVMHDTAELQHFLVDGLPYLLVNLISFAAIAGILLHLDWKLALLVFLPIPFLLGGGTWFRARLLPLFLKQSGRVAGLHSTLNESIYGIRIVKAFAREEDRSRRFEADSRGLFRLNFRIENTLTGFGESMFFIMSLGVTAVWYFAGVRIAGNDPALTLGDLLAFVGYIWLFYGPLQWFTMVMNWMTRALSGAERIFTMLDSPPESGAREGSVPAPAGSAPAPRIRGAVRFGDVRFSYDRGKEILKGVSFQARPGEMIGLVGKSGAGKSTITNLLCRFFEPDSGLIEIDGRPIGELDLQALRRQMGMVLQEPFLFNVSILENIRYGRPDASFEEVVRAAKAAHAHEFILEKEDGYDTLAGEKGGNLSGGERQRISIARAILSDPPILILDEATSSVDTETEAHIQEAIRHLVKGRTTIAIAHRLATLRHADRLIVMDGGRIVEEGTHEELLALDGHFARLAGAQAEKNRLTQEIWNV